MNGNGYAENPKYIAEEVIHQGLECDMVWLLRKELMDKNSLPKEIRAVRYGSLRAIYELATAGIWVDNARKYYYEKKRKGQYYIQTWHGSSVSFKKVERDAEDVLPTSYIESAKEDSKKTDLFVTGISQDADSIRRTFWYDGEVLKCGNPKLDIYFKQNIFNREDILKQIGINNAKKIALYVPTFRRNHRLEAYDLDFKMCIEALSKRFSGQWVIMMRLHPDIMDKSNQLVLVEGVYNVTDYEDTQQLIAVSDVMITDFSGLMFEAAAKKMTCFLYASDADDYLKNDRGTYQEITNLPFVLSRSNEELDKVIKNYDESIYKQKLEEFWDRIGVMDRGTASEQIVERIKDLIS